MMQNMRLDQAAQQILVLPGTFIGVRNWNGSYDRPSSRSRERLIIAPVDIKPHPRIELSNCVCTDRNSVSPPVNKAGSNDSGWTEDLHATREAAFSVGHNAVQRSRWASTAGWYSVAGRSRVQLSGSYSGNVGFPQTRRRTLDVYRSVAAAQRVLRCPKPAASKAPPTWQMAIPTRVTEKARVTVAGTACAPMTV